jgi:hypothetical protein
MKIQLRILPLRNAQGQDDRPDWDVDFHGGSIMLCPACGKVVKRLGLARAGTFLKA